MTPTQIKAHLEQRGTSLANVSRQLNVSKAAISSVAKGRVVSRRIEHAIAEALDKPLWEVFPGRYEVQSVLEPVTITVLTQDLNSIRADLVQVLGTIDRMKQAA
jgi:lambda repressor-like predicted transcriptional regulator